MINLYGVLTPEGIDQPANFYIQLKLTEACLGVTPHTIITGGGLV